MTKNKEVDLINAPPHYLSPNSIHIPENMLNGDETFVHIQAIDVIEAWDFQFCGYMFNVVKYILRRKETQLKDLKKARYYLDKKIVQLEKLK